MTAGWMLYKGPLPPQGYTAEQKRRQRAKEARARAARAAAARGVKVSVGSGDGSGGYVGLTPAEIEARANASADAQIGTSRAEIQRQQAAAAAAAQRDASTLRGLGESQMGMISQIPSQIQNIRDTAGAAMAGFGSTVAGAEQKQLSAEQAANAAFTASQVGPTAPAPSSADPAAVAAATGALARAPADAQVEIGGASAIAAAGMPAVVARATQDQVMQRLAEAASTDADYRSQLITLAATRGGVYNDALDHLYNIEKSKFGEWEARQRLKLDQDKLRLEQRAEAANEKIAKVKGLQSQQGLDLEAGRLTLATQREANRLQEVMAKGAQPNAALSKVYGHVVDVHGNAILGSDGQQIKVTASGGVSPASAAAKVTAAKNNAFAIARRNSKLHYDDRGNVPSNKKVPTRTREHTITEIIDSIGDSLRAIGYTDAQIRAIAVNAVKQYYGG